MKQTYDYTRRINWFMFWDLLNNQGMADAAGCAEHRRRTAELIEFGVLTDEAGEPVTDFKQDDLKYPHDKLYITKLDAAQELLNKYFDGKFAFLVQ